MACVPHRTPPAVIKRHLEAFLDREVEVVREGDSEAFVFLHGHDIKPFRVSRWGKLREGCTKEKVEEFVTHLLHSCFPPIKKGKKRHFVFALISPHCSQKEKVTAKVFAVELFQCGLHRKLHVESRYIASHPVDPDGNVPCPFTEEGKRHCRS